MAARKFSKIARRELEERHHTGTPPDSASAAHQRLLKAQEEKADPETIRVLEKLWNYETEKEERAAFSGTDRPRQPKQTASADPLYRALSSAAYKALAKEPPGGGKESNRLFEAIHKLENRKLTKKEALVRLQQLSLFGRYADSILEDAKERLR